MMRAGLAAIAALVLVAVPATAQPTETARIDRLIVEAGRWSELLGEAIMTGTDGFQQINQRVQALVATPLTRDEAAAAAPGIRLLIERSRGDLRQSNAMLAALPPFPDGVPMAIPPAQLLADARAHNARLLQLLNDYDGFIIAMGKADLAAMGRVLPQLMEGAFALVGQQRLLFRNRQASVPATDTTHQALGIAGQIYRAIESVARHSITARTGSEADATKAAADLRDELRLVADDARALAGAGRRNLERELTEVESFRRTSSGDAAEARLIEKASRVVAAEEKVFKLADRLVAFAEAGAGVTGAQLGAPGRPRLLTPLMQFESDYMAINLEQAALAAEGAN